MNLQILKKKNFLLLIIGEMMSLIGTQIQDFALALYVLKITGSATKFASVLAVAFLPQIVLGPLAGVLVDWFDRKKIIVALNFVNGIVVLALTLIFYFTGELKLSYIYVAIILMAINQVMFSPAVGTMIPTIIPKDELVYANSVQSFVQGFAVIVSPMLAGTIYGFLGLFPILMFNAISFIFACICEGFIKIPKKQIEKINFSFKKFKTDFKEGLVFVKRDKLIFSIVLSAAVINFSLAAVCSVGLTFISKNILKVSDFQYGIMSAVICTAYIFAPVITGKLKDKSFEKIFKIVISAVCLILIGMAVTISPLYLERFSMNVVPAATLSIIMFMILFLVIILNILLSTMFQLKVPNSMLGRVGAVFGTLATVAAPLGQIIFALLFDKISAYMVILIAIFPLMIALCVFCYASREKNSEEELTEYID